MNARLALLIVIVAISCHSVFALQSETPTSPQIDLALQSGHSGQISAVAYSPNGRLVVTGSHDGNACIWEEATRRKIRCFVGHALGITGVAFSPDDKYVLTGSGDNTVRLWSVDTGDQLRLFRGHSRMVTAVAFSPDGRFALSGGLDGTARIWNVSTGRQVQLFNDQKHWCLAVSYSHDGRFVLTGSDDGVARMWNVATGIQVHHFSGHSREVLAVAFSPDDRFVLTGSADHSARIWEIQSSTEIRRLEGHSKSINAAAYSHNGQFVVTGSRDRTVRVWDVRSAAKDRVIAGQAGLVYSVSISPDDTTVAVGSWAAEAGLWDVLTGHKRALFEGLVSRITSIRVSHTGRILLVGHRDGTARIWDIKKGMELRRIDADSRSVNAVDIADDESRFVTGGDNNLACLWRMDDGVKLRCFEGHSNRISSVALSIDGRFLLTGSWDGSARLWDASTGQNICIVRYAGIRVLSVAISADNKLIVVGGDKGTERHDVSTCERQNSSAENPGLITSVLMFRKNRVAVAEGNHVSVHHATDKVEFEVERFYGHRGEVTSVAISPDGEFLVTGSRDRTVRVWSVTSGKEVSCFEGHSGEVTSVAFSADGNSVFSGSRDGSVRMWRLDSGRELASLVSTNRGTWIISDRAGRFDTNHLEELEELVWVVRDSPDHSLPVEIFMRDFYQPQLLSRLTGLTAMGQVPNLLSLNRLQPRVKLIGVRRGASPDVALVDVEVSAVDDVAQPNGKTHTDVYDLRLFRDGQLVGRWPDGPDGSDEIEAWRRRTRIEMSLGLARVTHRFVVGLPTGKRTTPIKFTAYAFNEDRVKSATAEDKSYSLTAIPARHPKAYVVNIGVNGYEASSRNLSFAVRDAKGMGQALEHLEGYGVVRVALTSEADPRSWHATKANIRAVLGRLAGKQMPPDVLANIAGAEKLSKATPDDLVLISFSGHGYTAADGAFYMLPSDSGKDEAIGTESLGRFISSQELSEWLRAIDAGQMAMIIDACHSAASVGQPGFKPGPMGDRGLGQLAYDKSMRILAATQSDDVALESDKLQQGLLTYALVRDGLARNTNGKRFADTNSDGVLTLTEWLQYGERRTPGIYEDIRANRLVPRFVARDSKADPRFAETVVQRAQTPTLFNFDRRNFDPVIQRQ